MRFVLVSAIALTLAACGQQPTGNESADAGKEASGGSSEGLKLSGDGLPSFRPGAWEVTETSEGTTEKRKECLGEQAREDVREALTRDYPKECKIEKKVGSGGIYLKAACNEGGMGLETEIQLTGSDTQSDMKAATYVTMPDGKRQGGVTTVSGRWVGECPAGVKPGDRIQG